MPFRVEPGSWKTGAPHGFLHEACPERDPGLEMREGIILSPKSRSEETPRGGVEESVFQQGGDCSNDTLRCLRARFTQDEAEHTGILTGKRRPGDDIVARKAPRERGRSSGRSGPFRTYRSKKDLTKGMEVCIFPLRWIEMI